MTFVALHADRGRVNATLDDLGCGWVWSEIHRRRPRVRLCCQQCDHPVHAKVSSGGLRFFAHDPERRPDCPAARETMEHHLLKLELATAVRSTGWRAELEATRPGAQWRADVLAVCSTAVARWRGRSNSARLPLRRSPSAAAGSTALGAGAGGGEAPSVGGGGAVRRRAATRRARPGVEGDTRAVPLRWRVVARRGGPGTVRRLGSVRTSHLLRRCAAPGVDCSALRATGRRDPGGPSRAVASRPAACSGAHGVDRRCEAVHRRSRTRGGGTRRGSRPWSNNSRAGLHHQDQPMRRPCGR